MELCVYGLLDCQTNYLPLLDLILTVHPRNCVCFLLPYLVYSVFTDFFLIFLCFSYPANPLTEVKDEPFLDSVSGANSLSFGQCLFLHIPPTQLAQVGVLQLSWDQLLQVNRRIFLIDNKRHTTMTNNSLDIWGCCSHWYIIHKMGFAHSVLCKPWLQAGDWVGLIYWSWGTLAGLYSLRSLLRCQTVGFTGISINQYCFFYSLNLLGCCPSLTGIRVMFS